MVVLGWFELGFQQVVDDEEDSVMATDVGEGLYFYGWVVC